MQEQDTSTLATSVMLIVMYVCTYGTSVMLIVMYVCAYGIFLADKHKPHNYTEMDCFGENTVM